MSQKKVKQIRKIVKKESDKNFKSGLLEFIDFMQGESISRRLNFCYKILFKIRFNGRRLK